MMLRSTSGIAFSRTDVNSAAIVELEFDKNLYEVSVVSGEFDAKLFLRVQNDPLKIETVFIFEDNISGSMSL